MHSDCTYLLNRWWIIISTIKLRHSRCWIWLHGKGCICHFHRILEIYLLWVGISYVVKWWGISIDRCLPWSSNVLGLYGLLWSTRLMLHIGTTVDHWYCCLLGTHSLVLCGVCPFQGRVYTLSHVQYTNIHAQDMVANVHADHLYDIMYRMCIN